MLKIETNRAFRTEDELRRLVEAILDAPADESEPDWVEWKNGALANQGDFYITLARHIIGLGNRSVESSRLTAEGTGYVVLGAEPRVISGLNRIDNAELTQGIGAFLGQRGPRWHPHWFDIDEKTVLVITIEAPQPGDRIHRLEKGMNNYRSGMIFHRKAGKTDPANAAEIDMLQDRLLRTHPLDLQIMGPLKAVREIPALDTSPEQFEVWLAERRASLLEGVPASSPPPRPTTGLGSSDMVQSIIDRSNANLMGLPSAGIYRETRTPEEYRQEVEDYLAELPPHLPAYARGQYILGHSQRVRLALVNTSDRVYEDVHVTITARGAVWMYELCQDARSEGSLPSSPRKWGVAPNPYMPWLGSTFATSLPPRREVVSGHGDVHRLEDRMGDVRGESSGWITPFYLIADSSMAGKTVTLNWKITAKNVDGIARENIEMPVSATVTKARDELAANHPMRSD